MARARAMRCCSHRRGKRPWRPPPCPAPGAAFPGCHRTGRHGRRQAPPPGRHPAGQPGYFPAALLEQPGILKHKGHLPHEGSAVQLPHVRAAHGDAAAVHIPEPGDQAGGGGLAPAGGSHQSHHFTGLDGKAHILQRGPVRAGVGEGHMVKGHGVVRQPLLGLRLLHGLLAQNLIQTADGLVGLHHRLAHIHDAIDHLTAGGGEQGVENQIHQRGTNIPAGGDEQRCRDQQAKVPLMKVRKQVWPVRQLMAYWLARSL